MVKIRTLNELSQLRKSDFNQPSPRHGLNLLYWFASEQHWLNPKSDAYGFHKFHNRIDDDDEKLLPDQNLPYYEVGNLYAKGADKLPDYVRPNNRLNCREDNKDRIIVRLNNGLIDRVYVTEHEDRKEFDSSRTYRVSQGLLDQIRSMSREHFLKQMEQQRIRGGAIQSQLHYYEQSSSSSNQQSDGSWSWCTIL